MERSRNSLIALLAILVLGAVATTCHAAPGPWIELGAGRQGTYLWSVKLKYRGGQTGQGLRSAKGPCLLVTSSSRSSLLDLHRGSYRECTRTPLQASGPPLIATSAQPSSGAPPQVSAVGIIFAAAARRARVTFGNGRRKTIPLSRVVADPRQPAGAFRYAAFSIHGEWCAERLVSFGAQGNVLWDSGEDDYPCGSSGEPEFVP